MLIKVFKDNLLNVGNVTLYASYEIGGFLPVSGGGERIDFRGCDIGTIKETHLCCFII